MKKILLGLLLLLISIPVGQAVNIPSSSIREGQEEVGSLLSSEITQHTDLAAEIVRVVNWLLGFLGFLCILILIYAGVQVLMSGGSDEKVKKLWKTIRYVVTGLLIIAFSYGIVNFVITGIVDQTDDAGGKLAARFTCRPYTTTGAQAHSLECDASASAAPVETYLWNFGDGGNEVASNGAVIIHAFPTANNYAVKLKVSQGEETGEATHTYNVK